MPPRSLKYTVIDAFSDVALCGNPVAVFRDAEGLSTEEMQQITSWLNLSESTFVLPPTTKDADYRARIFTPKSELPFAGHPTIGTCHAVGLGKPNQVQECHAGLIPIALSDNGLYKLTVPYYKPLPLSDEAVKAIQQLSGLTVVEEPLAFDVGPKWLIAEVSSTADLAAYKPPSDEMKRISQISDTIGINFFARTPDDTKYDIVVRTFAPLQGVEEDPVCGSGNGALAAYRAARKQLLPGGSYVASQGTAVGRFGSVYVGLSGDCDKKITVGGRCNTTVEATLTI